MAAPTKRLGEILIDAGLVDEYQVNAALTEQKRWGGKLGIHLVKLGYVTEEALLDVLRNQLKMPTVNLLKVKIPAEVIATIPGDLVKKHMALPVGIKPINGKDHLVIAMADPTNLGALDEIQFATKLKILPAIAGPLTLDRAIRYYYDNQGDLFAEGEDEKDPFSPTTIRTRMDMMDGSPTVTGESLERSPGLAQLARQKSGEAAKIDLLQMRAELTALRDMLIEKGLIDRRSFVEEVIKVKSKASS